MLAEFRVSNYRSFKDEQVLSMVASSEESKGKNSVELGGYNILKTAVVYGANASGKSNLIKAMACMIDIVKNSAGYKPSGKLPVTPFLFDEKTPKEPTSFEVTFFIDKVRYQYGFSATKDKIHGEWLLAWPIGNKQVWFQREAGYDEPYFGPKFKGPNKSTWSKVKDNSLFLSVGAQWNHELLAKVYNWFDDKFRELPGVDEGKQLTDGLFLKSKDLEDGVLYRDLVKLMFKKADFGIDDFEVEQIDKQKIKFPKDMPNEVRKELLKQIDENPPCLRRTFHRNRKFSIDLEEESDGTQRFYSLLAPLLYSAVRGYTIFEDELELNFHPLLTRSIIDFICYGSVKESSAQLIFTTHDTTLLDPELFGRSQVWFTEKDKDGATQLFSLADYKDVRKGEAMQKRYLAGRYGAIPVLERFDIVDTEKQ